jgi:hypothetical protein
VIALKNSYLQINIQPGLGGRIDDLIDLRHGKNWLWHPDYYNAHDYQREIPRDVCFDDRWTGGMEEIFPNDAPTKLQGNQLLDRGELWRRPWQLLSSHDNDVGMELECESVNVRVEKWIKLDPNEPKVEIKYNFYNNAVEPLPFLFKLHPALAIEPGDRFLMPPCYVEPVSLGFSRLIGKQKPGTFPFGWSKDGEPVRLDVAMSEESGLQEFVYASGLEQGYCGIHNFRTGTELMIEFSRKEFPYVWLFQSYGGFRGHYVAMLEPSTAVPFDLAEACRNKTCAILTPGESRSYGVTIKVKESASFDSFTKI